MPSDDFGAFYQATYPRIWSYVRRLVSNDATAGDFAQEAFVRLLQAGRDTLPEPKRSAYVFTIATNLVRDHWKRPSRGDEPLSESGDDAASSGDAERSIAGVDVARALAELPATQRSILWLAYAEGWDHRSIAHMVGLGEKSIKVLLFRAKKKLAAMLGGDA